jgi:hypothetical protein
MDTLIVGIITLTLLLLFAERDLILVLLNLCNLRKLKIRYLILKEKLHYFGILYHADIPIIIVSSGLVGYLIYKLSQGN